MLVSDIGSLGLISFICTKYLEEFLSLRVSLSNPFLFARFFLVKTTEGKQ
jgi:hypothetical protein